MEAKYIPNLVFRPGANKSHELQLLDNPSYSIEQNAARVAGTIGWNRARLSPYFALKHGRRWRIYEAAIPNGGMTRPILLHKNLSKRAAEMWLMYRGRKTP